MPLGQALAVGEPGVEHGHLVAEARAEPAGQLRGERDLRHQRQRAAAERAGVRDGLQVDVRLAAPGHAVQQEGRVAARVERVAKLRERRRLGRGLANGTAAPGRIGEPGRAGRRAAQLDQAARRQPAQVRPGAGKGRQQLLHRNAGGIARQEPREHLCLARRPRGELRPGRRRGQLHLRRAQPRPGFGLLQIDQAAAAERAQLRGTQRPAVAHGAQELARARPGFLLRGQERALRSFEELLARSGERRAQLLAQIDSRRQRGADGETERRQVVIGSPAQEAQDVRRQERPVVEHAQDVAQLAVRGPGRPQHDSGGGPVAERHQHPPARLDLALREPVGEDTAVRRHGKRDLDERRGGRSLRAGRVQWGAIRGRRPLPRLSRESPSSPPPRTGQRARRPGTARGCGGTSRPTLGCRTRAGGGPGGARRAGR